MLRLTLQPFDAPPQPNHLLQLVDRLGSEEMLLYSTDYPHWHDDTPEPRLPEIPDAALAAKIMYENARALYRL